MNPIENFEFNLGNKEIEKQFGIHFQGKGLPRYTPF